MMAMIADAEKAPPIPGANRPMINMAWLEATPQSTDEAVKTAIPARKIFLRPTRSPNRPARRRKLPKVMRKASTTQARPAWEKCSSRWISGSATLTIDESRAFMNMPRQTTTRAHHRLRLLRPATGASVPLLIVQGVVRRGEEHQIPRENRWSGPTSGFGLHDPRVGVASMRPPPGLFSRRSGGLIPLGVTH